MLREITLLQGIVFHEAPITKLFFFFGIMEQVCKKVIVSGYSVKKAAKHSTIVLTLF